MRNRIITGLLLAILLFVFLALDGLFRIVAFSLFAFLSVYELQRAFLNINIKPFMIPAYAFAVSFYAMAEYVGFAWVLMLLCICVGITLVESVLNVKRTTNDAIIGLSVFVYPLMFYICLMLLCIINTKALAQTALLLTFAGPLVGDIMAYFIGVLFGKHKLCERLSPKKTIEGSVAGVFGGAMGGLLVFGMQKIWGGIVPLVPLLLLGLACGVVGQIGDLFASSIKRWSNIKDFGTIFHGHGGVLDRLDSVLLCAPIVLLYFYTAYESILGF